MKKLINTLLTILTLALAVAFINGTTSNATGQGNPRLIVENYWIDEGEVTPGEEFNLTLRIRNTSIYYDAYSVVVTVTDNSGNKIPYVYPVYGDSNQVYVEKVYSRNTKDISFTLKAEKNISISELPLLITITYNDNYYVDKQKNEANINVPIKANGDLKVSSCTVPDEVTAGTKARVSATYENTGLNNLSSVTMNVTYGKGMVAQNELYTVSGGEQSIAEVYLECTDTGSFPICVWFSYEDENGETYTTDELYYTILVTEGEQESNVNLDYENQIRTIQLVLIGLIAVVLLIIIINVKGRRR